MMWILPMEYLNTRMNRWKLTGTGLEVECDNQLRKTLETNETK